MTRPSVGEGSEARPARASALLALALALLAALAFAPALGNGFVWDDDINLVNNPAYRGLGWAQLRWMVTTAHVGHYIPLTWVTFGLDYTLWGMNPAGYHLTSLVLHAANGALVYLLALRLLARATTLAGIPLQAAAATAALVFAVHPLRVESVAWITERRDVLSGFFFLLTILTYLEAAASAGSRRRWLGASVVAYLLALASKSIVMTIPAILVLLDVYPLRRLRLAPDPTPGPEVRRLALEKLPYFLLTAVTAAIAYFGIVAGTSIGPYPWTTRIGLAVYGLWFYLIKTVVPAGLSPLYEIPVALSLTEPRILSALLGVVGISLLVLRLRREWPAGLAVWLYYAIVLAPVSGLLVTPGLSVPSDRYSYLSGLGFAVLAGGGLGVAWQAAAGRRLRPWLARLAAVAAVLWLVGLGTLTWRHAQVWRDSESLWRYAVGVAPECANCHNNLGVVLLRRNDPAAALGHFQEAARLRPHHVTVHGTNTALALTRLGRLAEAVEQYDRVLAAHPDTLDVRLSVATLLWRMDRRDEALQRLQQGLAVTPDHPAVHANLAAALLEMGRPAEAVEHYRQALAREPRATAPRVGLMRAYARLGRGDLARAELAALRDRDPDLARQAEQALPSWEAAPGTASSPSR